MIRQTQGTIMVGGAEERYFYHSFPRRRRGTSAEIEEGCAILGIIRDHGLALVPQVIQWEYPHADGSPNRTSDVFQQRVCFTELPPAELAGHARKFGRFALEFDIATLKALGAMPVFYIPKAVGAVQGAEWAANVMVMQLQDAYLLSLRFAGISKLIRESRPDEKVIRATVGFDKPKTFDLDVAGTRHVFEMLGFALTPPEMMTPAFEAAMRFFVPADDLTEHIELGYYREREWRIANNIVIAGGVALLQAPTPDMIRRLKALDPEFFDQKYHPSRGDQTRADGVSQLAGLNGRSVAQLARRIVVPRAALKQAKALFKTMKGAPPIVTLESLNRRARLARVMRLLQGLFRKI